MCVIVIDDEHEVMMVRAVVYNYLLCFELNV